MSDPNKCSDVAGGCNPSRRSDSRQDRPQSNPHRSFYTGQIVLCPTLCCFWPATAALLLTCALRLPFPAPTLALSCPALACPALPCPALPCPALPCPALPCPALPVAVEHMSYMPCYITPKDAIMLHPARLHIALTFLEEVLCLYRLCSIAPKNTIFSGCFC